MSTVYLTVTVGENRWIFESCDSLGIMTMYRLRRLWTTVSQITVKFSAKCMQKWQSETNTFHLKVDSINKKITHKHMFPQQLDQTTLTVEWINTHKTWRADTDIELAQKNDLANRGRRKCQKREVRSLNSNVIVVSPRSAAVMPELSTDGYVEIKGEDLSKLTNSVFETKVLGKRGSPDTGKNNTVTRSWGNRKRKVLIKNKKSYVCTVKTMNRFWKKWVKFATKLYYFSKGVDWGCIREIRCDTRWC